MFRTDLDDHMCNECLYRTLNCSYCADDYIYINKEVQCYSIVFSNFSRQNQDIFVFVDLTVETIVSNNIESLPKENIITVLQVESFGSTINLKFCFCSPYKNAFCQFWFFGEHVKLFSGEHSNFTGEQGERRKYEFLIAASMFLQTLKHLPRNCNTVCITGRG